MIDNSSMLERLHTHKLVAIIVLILYGVLGTAFIFLMPRAIEDGDFVLGFGLCLLIFGITILLVIGIFDRNIEPCLNVYKRIWLSLMPWIAVIGAFGAMDMWGIFKDVTIALIWFWSFCLALFFIFSVATAKLKKLTKGEVNQIVLSNLMSIPESQLKPFEKESKFRKWRIFIAIFVNNLVWKYLVDYKIVIVIYIIALGLFCNIALYKCYRMRYPKKNKLILHLLIDNAIYLSFSIFAILLNYEALTLSFKPTVTWDEKSMLIAFGLAPFWRQNAFPFWAIKHKNIRQEIEQESNTVAD